MPETFQQFGERVGIVFGARFVEYKPKSQRDPWAHFACEVTLRHGTREHVCAYRLGLGHCSRAKRAGARPLATVKVDRDIARALKPYGALSFFDCKGSVFVHAPKVHDALCNLQADARFGDMSFEDFCDEFGESSDSRKAYATWEACRDACFAMRKLFGAEFDAFMSCEEG